MKPIGYAALGAVIGSLMRFGIKDVVRSDLPIATFTVNIVGAFIIGLLSALPFIYQSAARKAFVVTGVLGGFTTYSAFALEVQNLTSSRALIYIVLTFACGILAVELGHRAGDRT